MQKRHQPEPIPITSLIRDALTGVLKLPEFQRHFVWKPNDVGTLLSSVAMGWPIGAFMIWDPGEFKLQDKPFDGVSPREPNEPPQFLLDGQQRLTALIHAMHEDRSKYCYYIDGLVKYLTADDEPDIDEHIKHLTKAQFNKRHATLADRAEADIALIGDVVGDQRFQDWTSAYSASHKDAIGLSLFTLREERLPGLKFYEVPCVMLRPQLALEAVARIFETTNKTGVKLGTVDLMTAKLYPSEFKLREEWDEVMAEHRPLLKPFENTIDAEDPLRILSYWHSEGKGITKSNILRLPAEFVKAEWDRAIRALIQALELLRDRCGVVQGSLLPASMMLVPVAVAADATLKRGIRKSRREDVARIIERWFWKVVAEGAFARSTNTRAIGQAKELVAILDGRAEMAPPGLNEEDMIGSLSERLLDPARGERALEAATLALIVSRGGRDWASERATLTKVAGPIEAHHVVPRKAIAATNWDRINCIGNLTPQSRESNIELKNDLPLDAGATGEIAAAHFCDTAELGGTNVEAFERFAERRAREIAEEIYTHATGRG